ncbi:cobalamin biosynthesis protein CbiX [Bacillus pseudomycoides]|uniref:sirohydrochlorin chelatase n=1 Tax=Bacillus pseudomycoides TaxID=64104 RepID=UPI000BF44ECA|nr:sirohydrochlorin chelatase [Bacillus pseudomycoides]PFW88117.1 cobalamin biosynthesis protein CbiX [Bacillus pseudomycoides]PFX41406.1 cobalamin biosynthesis protein CbiX [Bacillus pseudomycoides]
MKAVLYICHGSRLREAKEEAIDSVSSCMNRVSAPIQELCFLELAKPFISEGFAACVRRGATEIVVVPVFLLAAGHVKEDIPNELKKMKNKYPHIVMTYGNPFGVSESLVSAAYKGSGIKEYENEVTLLLVARGSSDPETLQDIKHIASLFEQEEKVGKVEVCYLAAAEPRFEEKLKVVVNRANENIVVLPYLLFTGLLMKHIEREVRNYSYSSIHVCPYLGKNHVFQEMLIQKTEEILRGDVRVPTYSSN